jgi:hypothetical protein
VRTYELYREFLKDFCSFAGRLRVCDLDSSHVAAWLNRHPARKGCRRAAIIASKRGGNPRSLPPRSW